MASKNINPKKVDGSALPTSNSGLGSDDLWQDNGSVRVGTSTPTGSSSIYTADGTLSGDRIVDLNGNDLDFKDGDLSASLTSYIGTSNPKGKFFSIPTNRAGYLDGSLWFRNLNNSTGTITPHHRFYSGGLPSYVGASNQQFLFGKTNNDSGAKFEMLAQYSGMFIHNNAPVTKSFLGLLHLYPDTGNGTVALNVENPVGSIIMARANSNREVILRGTNVIGSETISLQGSTLIKGEGTSTGSTLALYDNDTTPNKTWEWLDSGNVVVGQDVNFIGDSASVGSLKLYRPANGTNYGAGFDIDLNNSSNIQTNYGRFGAQVVTNTSGSEYGKSYVAATKNGVVTVISEFDSVNGLTIKPVTSTNLLKAGDVLTVSTTDVTVQAVGGGGTPLTLYRSAGGNGYGLGLNFDLNNSAGARTNYGRLVPIIESNTAGSETSRLELRVADSGTVTTKVKIKSNTTNIVMPTSNSGLSAGDLWEDNGVVRIGTSTSSIGGSSIYTADGTLSGDRIVDLSTYTLTFNGNNLGAITTNFNGRTAFISNRTSGEANILEVQDNSNNRIFEVRQNNSVHINAQGTGDVVLGNDTLIGSETISLQGSTLIKGAGTSTGTTLALYDNDTTPNKTWEWLDSGNVNIGQTSTLNFNNEFLTFDNLQVFDLDAGSTSAFVMRITAGNNGIANGPRIELYETSPYTGYAKSLIFRARKNEGSIKHLAYTNSTHCFYLSSGYSATSDFTNINRRFEIGDNLTFFQNTDLVIAPNVTTGTPALVGTEDISLQGHTAIKGTGTTTGTTLALYDNDTTPSKTWEWLDNGSATGNGLLNIDNTGGIGGVEHTGLVLESQGTVGSQLALDFKQGTFRIASVKSSVNATSDNSLILGTNQQLELLHLRKTNIGINESDPQAKLHVNGDSLFNDIATIDNSNGVQDADLTQLRLRTGGFFGGGTAIEFMHAFNNSYVNAKIRSVANGSNDGSLILGTHQQIELLHLRKTNVGINESNPQAKLHVNGTVIFSNLPTSATGLSSGDLWNDGGTLKIA